MSFSKVAVMFLLISIFAILIVGMASMMQKDKPTDSYYNDDNNTVTGSVALSGTVFGVSGNLMVPVLGIAGILVLFAGFMVLKKRGV